MPSLYLLQDINLAKQIPDKSIRDELVRVSWGIVPADGKSRSIKSILENENYYRRKAEEVEKRGSKK